MSLYTTQVMDAAEVASIMGQGLGLCLLLWLVGYGIASAIAGFNRSSGNVGGSAE